MLVRDPPSKRLGSGPVHENGSLVVARVARGGSDVDESGRVHVILGEVCSRAITRFNGPFVVAGLRFGAFDQVVSPAGDPYFSAFQLSRGVYEGVSREDVSGAIVPGGQCQPRFARSIELKPFTNDG